jgi:TetR/AcrR family transcriptional regulator, regulator of cefoperazone and chloramphenicol sensitivity
MAQDQEQLQETRTRLLEAAGEVFASRGFREATIRDICGRAGANIAAVNYHFRDKEGLYREVLAYTAKQSVERYPMWFDPSRPAEERLGLFVRNYMERLLDDGRPAWFGKLLAREMFEPTSALEDLARNFAGPMYAALQGIVGDLLGPRADERMVKLCARSVVGQCLFYKHARPMIERLAPEQGFGPADRGKLAEHITAFSLAAIGALRSCDGRVGGQDGGRS